jgi:hypothetical protein
MGIFLVERGTAELVVNTDNAADDGTRFDRPGDPVFSAGIFFRSAHC